MNTILKISLLLGLIASSNTMAEQFDGLTCKGKKEAIQHEITMAQNNNNKYKESGLKKALADVNLYCNNDDLETNYRKKVDQKLEDVNEKTKDLKKAELKNDAKKINRLKSKLNESLNELKQAEDNLNKFHQELKVE